MWIAPLEERRLKWPVLMSVKSVRKVDTNQNLEQSVVKIVLRVGTGPDAKAAQLDISEVHLTNKSWNAKNVRLVTHSWNPERHTV